MLYPGTALRVGAAPPQVPGMEVYQLPTSAGNVEAFFLPATPTSAGAPNALQPVVVFGHGNGEVIDVWVDSLDGFRQRGIGVLLVEYPGYGRSTGSPTETGVRDSMLAAYDRLTQDVRVDRSRIFGFGQSLGSGAVCQLAKNRPLRALILESAFPSLDMFARGYGAPASLLRDRYDNLSVLAKFSGPVLIIHGKLDQLIPWQQARRLADASPRTEFKLYDCAHGCWDPDHLPFWHDTVPFLAKADLLP